MLAKFEPGNEGIYDLLRGVGIRIKGGSRESRAAVGGPKVKRPHL